jgi:NADP-dependent 3-hydroxy acid dehydrogenase YdfG
MAAPKVVVVTGASSGVGRAATRAFASDGAAVGLLARGEEALAATAKEAEAAGGRALAVPLDLVDAGQVDAAAALVEQRLGPVDVWVNTAVASVFAPFTEIGAEEFQRVTEVAYLGVVNGTRAALRHMVPRDRGVVVQVGSALAERSIPLQSAYCGAKHAVRGFTESVRCELLHDHSRVHITTVQLPGTNTPQFETVLSRLPRKAQPMPPVYQPEVAARAIVWAAAHRRREVWVGSSTAATLLANRVAPGLLDHYLGRAGYDAQQSPEVEDPDRPVSLWRPLPGDRGAHGPFDVRAHGRSVQLWAATHRGLLAAAAAAGLAGAATARLRRR